jgi:type I restriction enzyme, S subunit
MFKHYVLKQLSELINQKSNRPNGYDYDVLTVSNTGGFVKQLDYFENRIVASSDKKNYKKVIRNDFAYNPARINVGSIARLKNIDVGIVSPMYLVFSTSSELDPVFLEYFFQSTNFNNQMKKLLSGSVRKTLDFDSLEKIKVKMFMNEDQKKIGLFLSAIDRIVEKYSNKAKALRKAKDSFIVSYIKSKNDEIIEHSIKDIFEITRGYVLAISDMSTIKDEKNPYPVYSSQTLNQGLAGYYKEYLYEDAITWTTDGANAGDVNFRKGKFYCTNVCGVLLSKKGFCNNYVAYLLSSVAKKYVSYVGNPKLMNGTMGDIKIKIPSIQEQVRIGNFISHLDSLIQQQEQYIAKFKMLKKYYLDLLFTIKEKM